MSDSLYSTLPDTLETSFARDMTDLLSEVNEIKYITEHRFMFSSASLDYLLLLDLLVVYRFILFTVNKTDLVVGKINILIFYLFKCFLSLTL